MDEGGGGRGGGILSPCDGAAWCWGVRDEGGWEEEEGGGGDLAHFFAGDGELEWKERGA